MRHYSVWMIMVLSMYILQADLQQELISLDINLSSLYSQLLKKAKEPEIGTSTSDLGTFNYIVYILPNNKKIRVEIADITKLNTFNTTTKQFDVLRVDAIVNAANESCLGGSGIDGAIHKAINTMLKKIDNKQPYSFRDVCANLPIIKDGNRCITGDAKLVPGVTLAKFIVQAVGPMGGMANRQSLLQGAYENSLKVVSQSPIELAQLFDFKGKDQKASNKDIYVTYGIPIPADLTVKSIAFPSISTGIFGYPKDEAAQIAIDAVYNFLTTQPTPLEEVIFIFYNPGDAPTTKEDYNRSVKILNKKLGYAENLGLQI